MEIIKEIKVDSIGVKTDKSVITIKETVDTTVVVPGKTITETVVFNRDSLINGLTAVKSDLVDVRFILDAKTGILSTTVDLKPQKIPVKLDRETKINKDVNEQSNVSKEGKDQSKTETKSTKVDKKPANTGIILAIVSVLAVIGAIVIIIRKKPKT